MAASAIYPDHKLIKSSHAAAWRYYNGSCWDCFIDKVQFAYDEPAGRLAMQMDDKQVAAFVAAVDALGAAE